MPEPMWSWCPAPGLSRKTTLAVDSVAFGDGYVHRLTRGINPARPAWDVTVPFTSQATINAIDAFLETNAAGGFWFYAPDLDADVFVICDDWSVSVADKNRSGGIIGTFSATFTRSFNPQPA